MLMTILTIFGWVASVCLILYGVYGLTTTAFIAKVNADTREARAVRSRSGWDLEVISNFDLWEAAFIRYGLPLIVGIFLFFFLLVWL